MDDDGLFLGDDTLDTGDGQLDFDVNTTAITPKNHRRAAKAAPADTDVLPGDSEDVESADLLLEKELAEDDLEDEQNMAYYMLGGDGSFEE